MPWKECSVMDERVRFVARLLEGEKIDLTLRGISKRTSAKLRGVSKAPVKRTISTQRRFKQELARSVRFPKSKLRPGHPSETTVASG
jgi:hypothetical protein